MLKRNKQNTSTTPKGFAYVKLKCGEENEIKEMKKDLQF